MLFQREAKPEEVSFLRSRGTVSTAATLRGMARSAEGKLALVEMKAVDDTYPMLGQLTLAPQLAMSDLLAMRDGAFGAAADPTLLARLSLKTGDRVTIGSATFQIRSTVEAEPDKLMRRHRLRAALPDQRGGPARHRTDPARQPGALGLPGEAA